MRFRYRDTHGKVHSLPDVTTLVQAIRDGVIGPGTPLALGADGNFQRAELVVAYQQAAVAVSRSGVVLGTNPAVQAPPSVRPRSILRVAIALLAAALVVLLLVQRTRQRAAHDASTQRNAAAVEGLGPATRAGVNRLVTALADSVAVAQQRLEHWVDRQGFDQRLRGAALLAPAGLRAVKVAAVRYHAQVDSVIALNGQVAAGLIPLADSLEAARAAPGDLLLALQDALEDWGRDLAVYAGLEHAAAATLDSLATFYLERQQSFAVRDGQPVFLSRHEAARAGQLIASLNDLSIRERKWADALANKHPQWMAALRREDRPVLGRKLFSGRASN